MAIALTGVSGTVGPNPASAAAIVDNNSPLGARGVKDSAWIWDRQTVAQPFTAQIDGPLTKVTLAIGRISGIGIGGPDAVEFTIAIKAMSEGVPVGTPLASKTFPGTAANLVLADTDPPTPLVVEFAPPPIVKAGYTYAIVFSTPDVAGGDGLYRWYVGDFCEFPFSLTANETESPFTWNTWPYPLAFTTYVDGTAGSGGTASDAPSIKRAESADASANLYFSRCGAGLPTATNYEYRLDGGSWTPASPVTTTSPITVKGLVNGTSYPIELRAVYSGTTFSEISTPVTVTPGRRPSEPTSLVAQPGNTKATVTFTAGNDGGFGIVNYEYDVDESDRWIALSPAAATSPVVIPGLTNGTPVAIRLRAVSSYAIGLPSGKVMVTPTGSSPSPDGGSETPSGGSGSSSGQVSQSVSPPARQAVVSPLAPVSVPGGVNAGEGVVMVDGRRIAISVQPASPSTWRVKGDGFSMEFVVQAPVGGLDGRFTARPGSTVDVSGDGYQPGTLVATYLPGVLAESLGQERVRSDGTFTVRARFPLIVGQYVFQVNGLASPTSVRSVNLGLTLVEEPVTASQSSWKKSVSFAVNSASLTPRGRLAINTFMKQHWTAASTAVVAPVLRPNASKWQRTLALKRATAVVAAMRKAGNTQAPRVGPATVVDPKRARIVTAWIRR